jgi:hypothetical protein
MTGDFQRTAKPEDEARFVMLQVEDCRKVKQSDFEWIWEETLQNYLVRPWTEANWGQRVDAPLLTLGTNRSSSGRVVLKDPESHQILESLLADELTLLFGDDDFIRSKPVGGEDAYKSKAVQGLEHYVFRLEGHYRALSDWFKDGKIFGLGILYGWWEYREQWESLRQVDYLDGEEMVSEIPMELPVYDDYRWRVIDISDFFWDVGATQIIDMQGASLRFTITKDEALDKVRTGEWDADAVRKAIQVNSETDSSEIKDKAWREGLDRPMRTKTMAEFKPMVGYCYYGNVPYKTTDGIRRRRIEVVNGQRVMSKPFYGRLPFFQYSPCTISGRFPGIAPLEVIRYTQDFTDAMLMLNAEGAARMVHPPHIVNRYGEVKLDRLMKWRPDVPVLANNVDAVKQLTYNPNLGVTTGFYGQMKQQMREGSGALGAIQGLSDGPNRESATGFSGRYRQAKGRPEAQARLTEREWLPPLAKHVLEQYQRYSTTEDLRKRLGDLPRPVNLSDILSDFDIEFVGSRIEGGRSQRLQAYREIFNLGVNPYAAPHVPWPRSIARFYRDLGLYEEAMEVGQAIEEQTMIAAAQPQNAGPSNGNGAIPSLPPSGLSPEQLQGGPLG